jgi:hypothetical protein
MAGMGASKGGEGPRSGGRCRRGQGGADGRVQAPFSAAGPPPVTAPPPAATTRRRWASAWRTRCWRCWGGPQVRSFSRLPACLRRQHSWLRQAFARASLAARQPSAGLPGLLSVTSSLPRAAPPPTHTLKKQQPSIHPQPPHCCLARRCRTRSRCWRSTKCWRQYVACTAWTDAPCRRCAWSAGCRKAAGGWPSPPCACPCPALLPCTAAGALCCAPPRAANPRSLVYMFIAEFRA